ncbi:MAG: ankyrin repeat domain-containing protein [Holosporales bacterium]|jgi:hypothetical protein|nr:ankyrin repeat domain-containing protein [Holosporales bacterium]
MYKKIAIVVCLCFCGSSCDCSETNRWYSYDNVRDGFFIAVGVGALALTVGLIWYFLKDHANGQQGGGQLQQPQPAVIPEGRQLQQLHDELEDVQQAVIPGGEQLQQPQLGDVQGAAMEALPGAPEELASKHAIEKEESGDEDDPPVALEPASQGLEDAQPAVRTELEDKPPVIEGLGEQLQQPLSKGLGEPAKLPEAPEEFVSKHAIEKEESGDEDDPPVALEPASQEIEGREAVLAVQKTPITITDAILKDPVMLRQLLDNKEISPNDKAETGWMILHETISDDSVESSKVLIQRGANVNAVCEECGGTPLWIAVYFQQPEIVQLLLERGADPNADSEKLRNVLAETENYEIGMILIRGGARLFRGGARLSNQKERYLRRLRNSHRNKDQPLSVKVSLFEKGMFSESKDIPFSKNGAIVVPRQLSLQENLIRIGAVSRERMASVIAGERQNP